ncbi:MAG: hypothetical protein AUH80_04105 [Chloroflexi bacterium 13_1_40CM_4_65_16]|nr:MAG: hypothetical protein AUH80_04105 [Chloroflexi bacterium 13_1_40CM_4_65_16]
MRLTCSSLSLYNAAPVEAIEMIAGLGFAALDLVGIPTFDTPHLDVARRDLSELDRLLRAVTSAKVEVANVVTVPTDGLQDWDFSEIGARVDWAVRACEALGAPRLVLDAGNPVGRGPVERPAALARWKSMFDEAYRLTSNRGISLAVEAPHTGTLAERFDQVEELLAVMNLPAVGVDFDTSHVFRSGSSFEEGWHVVGDRVIKVSLRDVDREGEFCSPGDGEVDFPRLMRLLRARQFVGDLAIELETPGITLVADQRREIELARTFLEGVMGQG